MEGRGVLRKVLFSWCYPDLPSRYSKLFLVGYCFNRVSLGKACEVRHRSREKNQKVLQFCYTQSSLDTQHAMQGVNPGVRYKAEGERELWFLQEGKSKVEQAGLALASLNHFSGL